MQLFRYYNSEVNEEFLLHCIEKGWHVILSSLLKDLIELGWDCRVAQIKEKFGGLRFYILAGSEKVRERVYAAEQESYHTCEKCGFSPCETKSFGGWLKTVCDTCADEYQLKMEKRNKDLGEPE